MDELVANRWRAFVGVDGELEDEERRRALGASARELAIARYSWDDIGRRLAGIYELVAGRAPAGVVAP